MILSISGIVTIISYNLVPKRTGVKKQSGIFSLIFGSEKTMFSSSTGAKSYSVLFLLTFGYDVFSFPCFFF
jgi:hypothetical protein